MTRILRLLLIAAVALPLWQPTAAQNFKKKVVKPKLEMQDVAPSPKIEKDNTEPTEEVNHDSSKPSAGGPTYKAPARTLTPITVADGTATNNNVPVRGNYYSITGYDAQIIYPSTMLTALNGKRIRAITFHAPDGIKFGNPDGSYGTGRLKVSMTTTTTTTFSRQQQPITLPNEGVVIGYVYPEYNSTTLRVEFNSSLKYTGDNLLVDVLVYNRGTGGATAFVGQSTNNRYRSLYASSSTNYGTGETFIPKATFELEDDISINTENLDFGTVATGSSKELSFTLTNNNPSAATIEWVFTGPNAEKFSSRSNATSIAGNGGTLTVPVTFAPGNSTGAISCIMKVTVGDTKYRVVLRGKGQNSYGAIADPSSVDMGEVLINGSGTKVVTVTNIGIETINPTITQPADGSFTVSGPTGDLASGESRDYTITFAPTAEQDYSSAFSLVDGGDVNLVIALRGKGVTTAPLTGNALDFGLVAVNDGNKVLNATISNPNDKQVTATLSTKAPFSIASQSVTLDANASTSVAVTFTPTAATSYGDFLTIDVDGHESKISLKGIGSDGNTIATRDDSFFEGITYTWKEGGPDATGPTHTSKLTDIATDPDQMIAMIKKVYTDKTIPGNYKRGFDAQGNDEANNDVFYTGVGTISYNYTDVSKIESKDGYSFVDSYGWGIDGELENPTYYDINNTYRDYYIHMNTEQYKPDQEGLTLLLVELNDDYDYYDIIEDIDGASYYKNFGSTAYDRLRGQVENTIKSVRIVTQAKRTGEGVEAGTLFKIDCDKMNKFYLLAKGQVRLLHNSYIAFGNDFSIPPSFFIERTAEWNYFTWEYDYSYTSYGFVDENVGGLFYHMFEQFSPVDADATSGKDDIYQELTNMRSFGVQHDCLSVPNLGHQFLMYGEESEAKDCQDVRDMMFFVPDYRMMKDNDRDYAVYQQYLNYNKNHQPKMGLYVIRQDAITPTVQEEEYYRLQLNWRTNLDDFLPSDEQEFYLMQVVVDEETGQSSYVPVYYLDDNGNYVDANGNPSTKPVPIVLKMEAGQVKNYPNVWVKREDSSKQVTYAIQGCDVGRFLSLQISNSQSYIIPGKDPAELVFLNDATHYSRFDAQRVRNCYSNKLTLENNVDGIKQANLTAETKLTITRIPQGGNVAPAEIAAVTFNPSNKTYTVQMAAQAADETEFPKCEDGSYAGYHANNGTVKGNGSWAGTYTVDEITGVIDLGTLEIFDNFVQAIPDDNSHPFGYTYNVTSNYEVSDMSIYVDASACLDPNTEEDWYAWTWPNGGEGTWIKGKTTEQEGVFKFNPVKKNFKLARLPKGQTPNSNWSNVWNQSRDLTVGGETFTATWSESTIDGTWSGNMPTAHSNTFRIPIYKTSSQINGVFSKDDVDGDTDGALGVPENVEFGVGVQLSSKTEILRYDTYRWGEQAPRYSVASADGDDEQDLPPTGQAMNQGEYYTVTMNGDTDNETNGETSVSSGTGTATFVDKVPGESENAAAYMYAPIVEVFSGRGDYNSYGGPLQSAAVGKLAAERDNTPELMSKYNWTANGKKYAYYNIILNVSTKDVPTGYQIYKIRAWRTVDPSILGEEIITERLGDENGKYMFEEIKFGTEAMGNFINNDYELGAGDASVTVNGNTISYTLGTFGAQKLRTDEEVGDNSVIDELNATFVVRMYFTRAANLSTTSGAPMLKDVATDVDGKYYIVEQVIPFTQKGGNVPTGLENLNARQVVGVKYYNVAGIESDTPFKGVNIVVTRYSDGSSTTTKILK